MKYVLILLYFFLGILFFHMIGDGFSVGGQAEADESLTELGKQSPTRYRARQNTRTLPSRRPVSRKLILGDDTYEEVDLDRAVSMERHTHLQNTQTWTKTWNPQDNSTQQWAALLEWLSLPKNKDFKIWEKAINIFRNGAPVYILTTKYVEPWGTAAQGAKNKAEIGDYGNAGPCYNPNTDNRTTRPQEALKRSDSRRKRDQAERDSRWLLVWERVAWVASTSGGKAIQIYIDNNNLSDMQYAEADIANKLLLPITRQPIEYSPKKVYLIPETDLAKRGLSIPKITYLPHELLDLDSYYYDKDIQYCKELLSKFDE